MDEILIQTGEKSGKIKVKMKSRMVASMTTATSQPYKLAFHRASARIQFI